VSVSKRAGSGGALESFASFCVTFWRVIESSLCLMEAPKVHLRKRKAEIGKGAKYVSRKVAAYFRLFFSTIRWHPQTFRCSSSRSHCSSFGFPGFAGAVSIVSLHQQQGESEILGRRSLLGSKLNE